MADLFRRVVSVNVGGILVDGLDLVFRVEKSLAPEPNKADLTIFGLSRDTISAICGLATVPVRIDAGYVGATSTIYLGELRSSKVLREGPEVMLALSSGDSEEAHKTARIVASVKRDAKAAEVLQLVAKAVGVKDGNLSDAVSRLRSSGVADRFADGAVFAGLASRELTDVCRSLGLTWSVQDGALQLLELGKALGGEGIVVGPATGMVGSPSVDGKGTLSVRMLMAPDVFPGRLVVVESTDVRGAYRIERTIHTGDTAGQDWYIDIEGRRY